MKIKLLNTAHPTYETGELSEQAALYQGGNPWRKLLDTWIPRHPQEMEDVWAQRKARATYENNAGPIVDLLAGALFTEAPVLDGLEGPWVEDFLEDVDGDGTPLVTWFHDRLVDGLVGRRAYAWVNLPARGDADPQSLAEEEAAGLLDAFLVPLTAEQVIDWETDAQGKLLWLMIRDVVHRRESPETGRQTVYRWTAIDRERIRRWEWKPTEGRERPEDDDNAEETLNVSHGFGELPVVELTLPSGLHAMGKLHDPAVELLRAQNDLSWGLHRAAHALLYIKSKWDDAKPVFGPGYYLRLGLDDDIGYAEPSGMSFELLAERITQLREGLYRVVHQMAVGADSSANRSQMSARSKAEDWRATEIVLSAYASLLRPFVAETMRLVSKGRGKEQRPTVRGLEGWHQEELLDWLEAAAKASEALTLSDTFRRQVAKAQASRVLQDLPEDVRGQIEQEIDAAKLPPVDPHPQPEPPRPPEPGAG